MTAEELVALIRKKYKTDANGYNPCVVLEQVPDGTGMYQSRWIDVVVFQMWASNGLTRTAFEIKVSRSDFLNEIQNPQKHAWCRESFHYFFFVAPKGIIQVEELPDGVGWFYPRGSQLCMGRQARINDNPKLDDHILSGFLRAAHKEIENSKRVKLEEVLTTSEAYKKTSSYMEATRRFLESRGKSYFIPDTTEDIVRALEEATLDNQLKQDRDKLLQVAGKFQREIAALTNIFLIIANKSLLARDELGQYLVKEYGADDKDGLESLRQQANDKRTGDYSKRYAELIELILKWENIRRE